MSNNTEFKVYVGGQYAGSSPTSNAAWQQGLTYLGAQYLRPGATLIEVKDKDGRTTLSGIR